MFDINENYGFNKDLADDGAKMILDPDGKEYFVVRRTPNPEYRRLLSQKYRRHERLVKKKSKDADALAEKLMAEVVAATVLIGWKGVGQAGKSIPYSEKAALDLLMKFPELKTDIIEFSGDLSNYQNEEDFVEIKKS